MDITEIRFTCTLQNGAGTRMRILHIGACFSIEIQHSFPAEHNILDSCVIQVIENNRANADLLRDFLFIFQIGILFLNNTLCFCARLI